VEMQFQRRNSLTLRNTDSFFHNSLKDILLTFYIFILLLFRNDIFVTRFMSGTMQNKEDVREDWKNFSAPTEARENEINLFFSTGISFYKKKPMECEFSVPPLTFSFFLRIKKQIYGFEIHMNPRAFFSSSYSTFSK
jgi:hypothetical protein